MRTPRLHWIGWLMFAGFALACADAARALPDDLTAEGVESQTVPALTPGEQATLGQFSVPSYTPAQLAAILERYRYVDPGHVVPVGLREQAIAYYEANKDHIDNKRFLSVVDFSLRSSVPRFHIMDMTQGTVITLHVAHGKGSDPSNTGMAIRFSNTPNSEMSSLGFYRTASPYDGVHGLSLRLDGLSPTNSNVRSRAIVIHGADYVVDHDVKMGRSWGCLAVPMDRSAAVVNALKGGSIILAGTAPSLLRP